MTEKEAWLELAKRARATERIKLGSTDPNDIDNIMHCGLCNEVWNMGLSRPVSDSILKVIQDKAKELGKGDDFVWLRNAEGYVERAKFCEEQAAKL